ncbi:hypothetical protein A5647_17670 [Mycobacterium sp. 1100029.7]|nr:hypothetical protein A5647_17670 [Mycobacterium sp. 1100029.7]
MRPAELNQFLKPTLLRFGFNLDEIRDAEPYGNLPAWALYYRRADCKLQICWSSRDGGIDFLLAPLDAPNEFGLRSKSKKWKLMLLLSDAHDDLATPGPDAGDNVVMSWLESLLEIHFEAARNALLSTT